MADVLVNADLDFGGQGRPRGIPSPTAPDHAVNKAYADAAGGGLVITSVEVDLGASPVKGKSVTVTDGAVTPSTKILAYQAGRAATGRPADENEWTRLHIVANAGTGSITFWIRCLTGRMRGRFIIDYVKG